VNERQASSDVVFRERWEVVTDEIRLRILRGDMLPGSRIVEADLAEMFGVSRGPVREALRVLETAGMVRRLPRHGSYVAPIRRQDVEEIYSLRRAIEELAIRRTLATPSSTLVATLERSAASLSEAVAAGDVTGMVEGDVAFHATFYDQAAHGRLQAVWASLTDPLRMLMRLSNQPSSPHWVDTVRGHQAIMDSASRGAVEDCVDAMRDHLARAETLVLSFVERQELQD
jgi:GntR family transcriptional regulator of gluconate operon